jgi:Nickel responsive protein SCO4226-like
MEKFLVETYLPRQRGLESQEAAGRARRVAEELTRAGTPVRYLRTLFVAEDETCFHVFEGASADVVAHVSRDAGIDFARIVPVTLDDGDGAKGGPAN